MKRTVDFTIRGDFNNKNDDTLFNRIFSSILLTTIGKRKELPWRNQVRQITNDSELSIQHGGLYSDLDYYNYNCLVVGTKKDRKRFDFDRSLNENICERCGKQLQKVIWKRTNEFCDKCNQDLKSEKDKQLERICWLTNKNYDYNQNKIAWKGGNIV